MDKFLEKVRQLWKKTEPARHKTAEIAKKVWAFLKAAGSWAYKLRSVILAIPVAVAAVWMAVRNLAVLPEQVGINLLENGEFAYSIGRSLAVMGPLAVTAVCLLMMFCSKKVLYPWLISVFSLVLPLLQQLTTIFA